MTATEPDDVLTYLFSNGGLPDCVGARRKPAAAGMLDTYAPAGVVVGAVQVEIRPRYLLVAVVSKVGDVVAIAGHDVDLHHPARAAEAAGVGTGNERVEHARPARNARIGRRRALRTPAG